MSAGPARRRAVYFHGTRRYTYAFVLLFGGFAAFTYVGMTMLTIASVDYAQAARTTAAVPLGRFTGAIAREWQPCFAAASWRLFPIAASGLALALGMLFVPMPIGRGWDRFRFALWIVGWFVWFGSGIESLGHALE